MGHISGFDAEREIATLQSKGLIFQEGERYFNLVLAKEPPKMTLNFYAPNKPASNNGSSSGPEIRT
jgi:hypothetical protein